MHFFTFTERQAFISPSKGLFLHIVGSFLKKSNYILKQKRKLKRKTNLHRKPQEENIYRKVGK